MKYALLFLHGMLIHEIDTRNDFDTVILILSLHHNFHTDTKYTYKNHFSDKYNFPISISWAPTLKT